MNKIDKLQKRIDRIREDATPFDSDNAYANGLEEAIKIFQQTQYIVASSFAEGFVDGIKYLIKEE